MAPNATEKLHDEEDRGVLVYDAPGFFANDSKVPRWIQSLVTDVFSFVILHYFVWGVPFLVLFYIFHKYDLDYVSIAMVVLYLPSFFSGAHKTGTGNVWEDATQPEDDAAIIPVHTRTSSGQSAPRRRNQGRNETKHPFAWTVNAAEVLLRLRFDSLKGLFDGTKNLKQLSAAWDYLAAETHRIGGLEVDATQCKSKL
ncbi:uncharacterized protein PITG_11680 [Phytophthora infestans T30-4]|uniref:Transmembrane protein n=1 Tax=Phytophthora infestans (strain T30-4) TaxID=403677 RepID=D0NIB6_PHYIT|nr:uncharacterized protein PITG_11680 [Phytophthora infestans T30-4]EEY59201.1 conserved hypothetical protein [Phytophthora infestans T30-4]|eukprot:XP_002901215.1 conserved hypothetical protein [Phytophthora infestans T30-4]